MNQKIKFIKSVFFVGAIIILAGFTNNQTAQNQNPTCFTGKVMEFDPIQFADITTIKKNIERYTQSWGGNLPSDKENNEEAFKQINNCVDQQNAALATQTEAIKNEIDDYYAKKALLEQNKDIVALKKQKEDLAKSIAAIKKNVKEQIEALKLMGVYAVVLNEGYQTTKAEEKLKSEALSVVVPEAVKDLNGEFIQALQNYTSDGTTNNFSELIRQSIRGNVEIVTGKGKSGLVNNAERYMIILTVAVSPLKAAQGQTQNSILPSQGFKIYTSIQEIENAINFKDHDDKEATLNKFKECLAYAQKENLATKNKNKEILDLNNQKIEETTIEKEAADKNYSVKSQRLTNIFMRLGLSFNENNVETVITNAQQTINTKISQANTNLLALTAKKLENAARIETIELYSVSNAPDELASKIKNIKENFIKDGRQTIYENTQTLTNGQFAENTNQSLEAIKTLNKFWIYMYRKGNFWKIHAFAKYDIKQTKDKPSSIGNGGSNVFGNNNDNNKKQSEISDLILGIAKTEMVFVEGGTFNMGCTPEQGSDCGGEEKPVNKVTLSSYYIGKYEVTQGLWEKVLKKSPSSFGGCDECPVENVSWEDCIEFINKLNELTGKDYRLPTEAQWEYAARGGNKSQGNKFAGGNDMYDLGWYAENSAKKPHKVGLKKPNELGLFDMSGNVWEWCRDWYGAYESSSQSNPIGANSGESRVRRGGSWYSLGNSCRVSIRYTGTPSGRTGDLGAPPCPCPLVPQVELRGVHIAQIFGDGGSQIGQWDGAGQSAAAGGKIFF